MATLPVADSSEHMGGEPQAQPASLCDRGRHFDPAPRQVHRSSGRPGSRDGNPSRSSETASPRRLLPSRGSSKSVRQH